MAMSKRMRGSQARARIESLRNFCFSNDSKSRRGEWLEWLPKFPYTTH